MNKIERHSFIANLIKKNSAGRMDASRTDIEEEKKLALAANDDNSIEDEEASPFVNPALRKAIDASQPGEEKESEFLLSAHEKSILFRELGKPVSLSGLKPVEAKPNNEDEIDLEKLNLDELIQYAEAHG